MKHDLNTANIHFITLYRLKKLSEMVYAMLTAEKGNPSHHSLIGEECRLREWRNDGFRFHQKEVDEREKGVIGGCKESPSACFFLGPDGLFTGSTLWIPGQYVVVSIEVPSIRQVLALLGEEAKVAAFYDSQ
ncbi:uncharacterized protein CDAR_618341 [Caerostris darwini]|uniref:Uncharacterized protein n=1 Tax=Caerostris darwini TaxID=1538125 RepID=A0AAV4SWF5_9ARAC|nr:uncharacterized protein CDAR_618341 [Caerostris darwini]